jgi:hypothetical protein
MCLPVDSMRKGVFCVLKLFRTRSTIDKKKLILQVTMNLVYKLKSSFRKFYSSYNDFVCNYRLSLVHMLGELFHALCWTVIYVLALTTGGSVYLISKHAYGGCDRLVGDAYFSMVPYHTH